MAPSTRKSKAVDKEAHPVPEIDGAHNGVLVVQLPEDLDSTNLSKLLTVDNVTSLTPDVVINMYRYILSQHHALENALGQVATAQDSLAIKDAEVEQAFQDLEVAQVETAEKLKSFQSEIDILKQQNATLEQSRNSLQAQLDAFNSSQKQTSHDADELRAQMQEREREKRGLAETLEKVLATETHLQNENTELRVQTQTQRKTISELQSQLAGAQASEANIRFKASTLEQQISLHEQSNEQLNIELSKQLARHAELRKSATEEVSRLQSELDQKVSECDEVSGRYHTLKSTHSNLDRKLHETLNKNRELQLEAAEASRTFQEEILAYKHVLEQHERMSTETKARINEIEREETALRETLQKREATLIGQTTRERERSSALQTKVDELEGIIQKMQSGELPVPGTPSAPGTPGPDGNLILSPTASVVARLQRGGRSITEVYADYVRIQKELQLEKQEKHRLETTLNDIFNEIQDRAPILTQQRLEYERVTAEANQLATQLSQAIETRDIQARAAQEATHTLEVKRKEITLLEKQAIDMGRQINGLLAHVAHLEDPSLPDEYADEPPTEGVLDSDAFISSHLVLFKNLRHLREQNQVLLKLSRKLGAQLEERERGMAQAEESEIMAEARQLIESLQKELLSAGAKAESYVRERDMFKSMLGRSQSGVGSGATSILLGPGAPDYHKMYDEEHAMLEELRQKWNKELANLRDDIEKGRVERDRLNQTTNQLKSQVDFHKHVEQLAKDANAGQAQEITALTSRNRELQVLLRETESRISRVTGALTEKSARMDALVSEVNLLKSEKTIMKSREDRLEHEHRTLVAERVRHNQTLEDYRKMKDELAIMWEQSKTALEAERVKLLAELTVMREELANERAITRARLTEKESEIKEISLRLTRTTDDLATTREALATAQTGESHLKIRVEGLTKQLQVAEEKLAVFEHKPGLVAVNPNLAVSEEERLRAQIADLSAELRATQLELTTALSNSGMYQALAQSTEEALEAERKRADEYSAKTEQELASKSNELSTLQDSLSRIQLQLNEISQQRSALQTQLESREAEFAREKALLEDLLTDVQGADKHAQESQVAVQQELLAEAQRTREAQQKYQGLLVDHAAVLKERDSIQQELMEIKESIKKYEADAKVAQSVLDDARNSWNTQSQALRQEVDDMRSRYNNLMEQNNLLHHQLGSVTRDAARLTEISESDVAALSQAPSSDSQVIELQRLVQHMKKDVDLLRGQNDLLKRESARQSGKISQLTNELEITKQGLNEERAEAAKTSLAPSDRQVLLAKVEENAALIDSNRLLRDEKRSLEERLLRKVEDLTAATLKLDPLQQDLYNLRSEIDLLKTENTHLTNQVSTWRTRATTLTTKYDRIDPAEHQKVKDECAQLQKDVEERSRVLEETQQQVSEIQGKLTSAEAFVEKARNAASTWKSHYENAKPRLAAMKERGDRFEAELATVQTELEASKAQNASLQQQLTAVTTRAEVLETPPTTRPSAPVAQPENVDVAGFEAQISQLRTEKASLETENNSLKEQVAKLVAQASAAPQAQPGLDLQAELNTLRQQNEGLTKNMRDMAGKLNEVTQRNRHLMDAQNQLTILQKKLADADAKAAATGANPPGDTEAAVAQRTQEIQAQAVRERQAAVQSATAQLRRELEGLKKGAPNVQEMQAQHAAELDALRARLDQTAAAAGGDEAMTAQIAALKAQHEKDLETTRENIRKELETRAKMMQLQMSKLRQENTALKAVQNQAAVPPATATTVVPIPAAPATSSVPPTPTDAAAPPAAVAAPTPAAGAPRGRGVGRGIPGQRGAAGRGRGRGTILDHVNQAMQAPPTPGELSILGAGQKRQREEETGDPGSLAKRLKPGEASLPAKPVPLNRNRPGAPGS